MDEYIIFHLAGNGKRIVFPVRAITSIEEHDVGTFINGKLVKQTLEEIFDVMGVVVKRKKKNGA